MNGALTRITPSNDSLVVSLQRAGGSKDTWILSAGPVSQMSLLSPPVEPVTLTRGVGDLPSRHAEDLFWLGRSVERLDDGVEVTVDLCGLPPGEWCVGLSAVTEAADGSVAYWALAHPPGKADFDRFWEGQNGVRGLFLLVEVAAMAEPVPFKEYGRGLGLGCPTGVGYCYLSLGQATLLLRMWRAADAVSRQYLQARLEPSA